MIVIIWLAERVFVLGQNKSLQPPVPELMTHARLELTAGMGNPPPEDRAGVGEGFNSSQQIWIN